MAERFCVFPGERNAPKPAGALSWPGDLWNMTFPPETTIVLAGLRLPERYFELP